MIDYQKHEISFEEVKKFLILFIKINKDIIRIISVII